MPDNNALANALLAALQRQRDEALNRLANAEAQGTVLSAENEALRKTIKEMKEKEVNNGHSS